MKECPKCGNTHEKKGIYCSRSCANARVMTEESNAKRRESINAYWASAPNAHKDKLRTKKKADPSKLLNDLVTAEFDSLGEKRKKARILFEQNGACLCGIKDWLGKPMPFELDHKDGNRRNNSRENLRVLCPNCHSQTPTWRGRDRTGERNSRHNASLV